MRLRKLFSLVLVAALLLTATPLLAPAALAAVRSGTFRNGGEWTLENGVYTVTGPANMYADDLSDDIARLITRIVLGPEVETTSLNQFHECENLEAIVVDPANPYFTAVDGVLYDKGMTTLINCPPVKSGSFTVPGSVKSIGERGFMDSRLSEIILPEGLESIGFYGFYGCENLTALRLPASLQTIDGYAFQDSALANLSFAGTVAQWAAVEADVESNLILALTDIACADGVTAGHAVSGMCGDTVSYTLDPDGTLTVSGAGEWYAWAFESNDWIRKVVLQPGVTEIGFGGLYWAQNVTEISIPDTVTHIGYEALYAFKNMTSVTIPASVTAIDNEAFNGCDRLREVHFGGTMAAWRSMVSATQYDHYTLSECTVYCADGVIASDSPGPSGGESSGTFAEGGEWAIDEEGVLTITGPARLNRHEIDDYLLQSAVTRVVIGPEVQLIMGGEFSYCYSLTAFEVDPANPYYKSLDGVLYTRDGTVLVVCPTMKTGALAVPAGVKEIGDDALIGCSLSAITLPDSLQRIGYQSFWGCGLAEITIPANVSEIAGGCFSVSDNLQAINVAAGNEYYCDVDGVLFDRDMTCLHTFPGGRGGAYTLPPVQRVGASAFYYNGYLASVTLPEGVTTIANSAFFGTALETVSLPASLSAIEASAFATCSRLSTINFAGTRAQWEALEIGDDNSPLLFSTISCRDGDVTPEPISGGIGENVTYTLTPDGELTISGAGEWDYYAFSDNENIKRAVLESGVTEVGWGAFFRATQLESVSIPDTVTRIRYGAFYACESLASIAIPASVSYIGEEVFDSCDILTDIYFAGTMAAWNAMADLDDNYKLRDVTVHCADGEINGDSQGGDDDEPDFGVLWLPEALDVIDDYAFMNTATNFVMIPRGCRSIGRGAFQNCIDLVIIDIPDTVTSIAPDAFAGCPNLTIATPYGSYAEQYARENGIPVETYDD